LIYAVAVCWAAAILTSCGTVGSPAARAEGKAGPQSSTDLLKVGDLLNIDFSGSSEPPTPKHEERIKEDGNITLPFLGPIQAAGKTRGQLQEEIHAAYVPKYYQRLTVIVKSESRFFYVEGMVKNSGLYPQMGDLTVLLCIAAAGDFNELAKRR
jgi:protein involved in polysaccharide export with SLBB domain